MAPAPCIAVSLFSSGPCGEVVCIMCVSVTLPLAKSQSSLCKVNPTIYKESAKVRNECCVTAVAIEVFLKCCINSFAHKNKLI